jgi:hypothetical protein
MGNGAWAKALRGTATENGCIVKETVFINLEPYEWRQSIRAEHGKRYNGRSLQMAARVGEGHDIELVGTDEKLDGLVVSLGIMEGEPTSDDGKPFENGIGLFVFNEKRPGGVDYGSTDAMVIGWFFLDKDLYDEVWSQVAADRYSSCHITVTVSPIASPNFDWAWDVKIGSRLFIQDVSVAFVRDKSKPKEMPPPKPGLFG